MSRAVLEFHFQTARLFNNGDPVYLPFRLSFTKMLKHQDSKALGSCLMAWF